MSLSSRIAADLEAKSPDQRREIAERAAGCLNAAATDADRLGAEELVRQLAADAVLLVREALAHTVRYNSFLPEDVAKRIAHDVESVSVPFLEVTEVFGDAELQALALTVREAARAAMARRHSVPKPLADTLAEVGRAPTARSLAQNPGAELDASAARILLHKFPDDMTVLERLAGRPQLPLDVVESLLTRVSEAARRKLAETYGMPDYTEPLVPDSFLRAMLRAISRTPRAGLQTYARELHQRGQLCPVMILRALQRGHLAFFEAAMSVRANLPLDNVQRLTRGGGVIGMAKLSQKAKIPAYLREDYRVAVHIALETSPKDSGQV